MKRPVSSINVSKYFPQPRKTGIKDGRGEGSRGKINWLRALLKRGWGGGGGGGVGRGWGVGLSGWMNNGACLQHFKGKGEKARGGYVMHSVSSSGQIHLSFI